MKALVLTATSVAVLVMTILGMAHAEDNACRRRYLMMLRRDHNEDDNA
jgi:hypothetical protein